MVILVTLFGILFMVAGIAHFIKPKFYNRFIPNFLPKLTVNYIVGIIEFIFGIGLLIPTTRSYACLGIFVLMLLFLPIHLWDATKKNPAIGSKLLAYIRIPVQFLFLYIAYFIYQSLK